MRWLNLLLISWWLGLAGLPALAVPSQPPVIPEGERFDMDALLAAVEPPGSVTSVAFSPDGRTLATASSDPNVRLWDVATGREIRRLEGHEAEVRSVAFSPDGETLASGSSDHTVSLWEVATGREIRRLEGHEAEVRSVAFSPDGETLASGSDDGTVRLWEVITDQEKDHFKGQAGRVLAVAFSPDGKTVAIGSSDPTVTLWDVATGRESRLHGHAEEVRSVAFSSDGKTVASGSNDRTVRLWEVATGKEKACLNGHADEVFAVAFGDAGKTVASGSRDSTVRLWDLATGKEIARFKGHSSRVLAVAFSPCGKLLASGSDDRTVRLWDVATAIDKEITRLEGHSSGVLATAFSPDGKLLVSGLDDGTVRLWDVVTGEEITRFEGHSDWVVAVTFSPDGKLLASGSLDYTVRLWDVAKGSEDKCLDSHSARVSGVAFSPDGKSLISGSWDHTIRLWDVDNGEEKTRFEGHSNWIRAVAFSPDGKTLASGAYDGTVRLWDVDARSEANYVSALSQMVLAVAFSPNGKILASGSDDGTVRLWEVGTREEVAHLKEVAYLKGDSEFVRALAFSPDGKILASGHQDGTVPLWDWAGQKEIKRLTGHSNFVRALAFSPNGKVLASGSYDGTVRLWSRSEAYYSGTSRIFVPGRQGTWMSCDMTGSCLRYDDGTLLVRLDEGGNVEPVVPTTGKPAAELELLNVPGRLETTDGIVTSFTLTIRNRGRGKSHGIKVRQSVSLESDPLVFHPPPGVDFLNPGDETKITCGVSAHSPYINPQETIAQLGIEITDARGESNRVKPIEVHIKTPSLKWSKARWTTEDDRFTLTISLRNVGNQDLSVTEFTAELSGIGIAPASFRQSVKRGETASVNFSMPTDFKPDKNTRVTLKAHKFGAPVHEWIFEDQPVKMPVPRWLPLFLTLLLTGTGLGVLGFRWYRHPLVIELSTDPGALLTLMPRQLSSARKLLRRTRRLDIVLARAEVDEKWLDGAIEFTGNPDPEFRCRRLADRLGVKPGDLHWADSALCTLPLGPSSPLNLERCFLYLPPAEVPPADVGTILRQRTENLEQVTLIISANPRHQEILHHLAADPSNQWVAPSGPQLTSLLLAADPVDALARLVASQVSLIRISPYQAGGGINKPSIFFGRHQILAHVLNRQPANYLVVGGRQIGKSSLLKAIERNYRDRPQAECHYVVLRGKELLGDLSRALKLPRETGLDDLVSHLSAPQGPPRLVLIDEVDHFIRAERQQGYPTLQSLRSLSETGCCHFILAGFWDLYEAVAFDYQSPLKNFGETLRLEALERDACRDLATRPMATMGLSYEGELVERLVRETGQRANLISIACNEILKDLDPKERMIRSENVDRALGSGVIEQALGWWKNLAEEEHANRLVRILVYATIRQGSFSVGDALQTLAELGVEVPSDQVEQALERLELAFVLGRKERRYHYRVPLFERMVLAYEPEIMLRRELTSKASAS